MNDNVPRFQARPADFSRQGIACFFALLLALTLIPASASDTHVTITPDLKSPGEPIAREFMGVSFEVANLNPKPDGSYLFTPENADLIAIFKSLGIRSLRVGGNTADDPKIKIPDEPEIDRLYAFARAADVSVIYNLRLKNTTDPAIDVRLAKYIVDHYKSQTSCITIGNEPDCYFQSVSAYTTEWKKVAAAILQDAPGAEFCGPSFASHYSWTSTFLKTVAPEGHLRLFTFHVYAGGNAKAVTDPAVNRARILNPAMEKTYEHIYQAAVPTSREFKIPYRLEETNSLYNGGAAGVSNTFASALWGLDYIYWWAQHGSQGLNFHSGNRFTKDESTIPGGYDFLYTTPSGFKIHPIGYAMKAFKLAIDPGGDGADTGRIVKVDVQTHLNLTAYGVIHSDKSFYLTVINREQEKSSSADIAVDVPYDYTSASQISLTAPGNDIAQETGQTLGGATIASDGAWSGQWTTLSAPEKPGHFHIDLPPATAAVIRFTPKG